MIRKGEQTAKRNERDYPYIVEVDVPPSGFGNRLDAMLRAHLTLGIPERRGQTRREASEIRDYARWCFADARHAESFARAFGGKIISSGDKMK